MVAIVSGLVVAMFSHPEWGSHDYSATHVLYSPTAARAAAPDGSAPLVDPFAMKLDAIEALATSRQVAEKVAAELGYDGDPMRLFRRVSTRLDAEASTISIRMEVRNEPELAVLVVDAIARDLIKQVDDDRAADRKAAIEETKRRLEALRAEISQIDPSNPFTRTRRDEMIRQFAGLSAELTKLEQAAPTTGVTTIRTGVARQLPGRALESLSPTTGWLLTLLLLSGLGVGLAVAVELVDARVSDSAAVANLTGLPVLAGLPDPKRHGKDRDLSGIGRHVGRSGRIVLVTSPANTDATTEAVVGLASAVAGSGRTALIIDADHTPRDSADGARGIADLAEEGAAPSSLASLVQQTAIPRVSMVPRGIGAARPGEFLVRHDHLLTASRDLADVVIVFGPGLLEGSESQDLARLVGETILVVRAGETRTTDARRAAAALYGAARAAAVVVLDEPEPLPREPLSVDAVRERFRRDATFRSRVEWAGAGVAMLVLYVVLRSFVMESYSIPTASMAPYLDPGDRVLVSKLSYHLHDVNRGDVIVFDAPDRAAAIGADRLVKRVIALPGETVESKDGKVFVNDEPLAEGYLPNATRTENVARQTVPADSFWVMGDNRANSADSRFFGPITGNSIVGRAFFHLWPWPIGFM